MKTIIVDDHSLFRDGLARLLTSQPDFQLVGQAGTIREAVSLVETQKPDLVIMDLGLPDGSGEKTISQILEKSRNVNVVFLTIHASEELAFTAIRHGARGFLMKDIPATALLSALRRLKRGELAVSRATLSRMLDELLPIVSARSNTDSQSQASLTIREIEILAEMGAGFSNAEIAENLSISENTVRVHVHNIMQKLNFHNRQETANYARKHGLANGQAKGNGDLL
ncbi:MAG: response regulator [Chloroflexota bacterium]